MDDPRTEGDEENEEDIEYVIEKLDTDEEEVTEIQNVKEEIEEIIDDEEETEKEIVNDLYTQLQSDDEDMKPITKKIKLSNVSYVTNYIIVDIILFNKEFCMSSSLH